jgi:mannose-6-phosphate isomerase-like protein (cupin superfamily)
MGGTSKKSFDAPDETRSPDKTRIEVVDLGPAKAARISFQPGWKWSECIKPVVGTDSCQAHHIGHVVSGRLHVTHNDGSELEVGPGDAYVIEPGHDAWVLGDDACVLFEFDSGTAANYARS